MTDSFDEVDIAEALADPRKTFGLPASLLANGALSTSEKIMILEAWQEQERTLAKHNEENTSSQHQCLTDQVNTALAELRGERI